MPTGQQARQALQRRGLCLLGVSTAAGAVNYLVDTTRAGFSKLSPQEHGSAFVRVTSGTRAGYFGQLERIDNATGRIYVSPSHTGGAFPITSDYEIWKFGIDPNDVDRAMDRALTQRCTRWRPKVLSVLSDVETWTGVIVGDETLGVNTLNFPHEYTTKSLQITNVSTGGAKSESYYVQPETRFEVYGAVSVHGFDATATIRVRDITNGADITLDGEDSFTLRGWQAFNCGFEIPDGCQEIQVWPGGLGDAVTEWAGIGLRPTKGVRMSMPSRVKNESDVRRFLAYDGKNKPLYEGMPHEIVGVQRYTAGDGVVCVIPEHVSGYTIVYEEAHRYAALVSDLGYFSDAARAAIDSATTDCPARYLEAATVVELLQHMDLEASPKLGRIFNAAVMELQIYDVDDGAEMSVIEEPRNAGNPAIPFAR